MNNNFATYLRHNYRILIPVAASFVVFLLLPPFRLFQNNHAASMLQMHLLLELFAVIVAILIAAISWHDSNKETNTRSGILLAGFSIVAMLDLVHALTYEGMPSLIIENSTHRAIFFWLAGRTVVLITLLLVALRIRLPSLPRSVWLSIALLISAVIFWVGTYGLDLIPNTFEPGVGLTAFKQNFEYVLFSADIFLALFFIYRSTPQTRHQYFAFATSCLVMAMAEIFFSNYRAPSDLLNMLGHLFKIVSYTFLYQSVFVTAIRLPFQQAKESEARFRSLTDLSTDWYWEQDKDFRFTITSTGVIQTGFSTFIGKTRWELPLEGLNQEMMEQHRKVQEQHQPFTDFTYQLRNELNELRTLSISGFPIYNDAGEFTGYRGIGSDITDQKATENQIELLAYHDTLTHLPNRLLMQDRFSQAIAHAKRHGNKFALLYIDLDNFKSINDSLGHETGDLLLIEVARRLTHCMRETDTISRQGGDEFLIIIPDITLNEDAVPFLYKVMEQLQLPYDISGNELSTSASIGVAIYPDDGTDFESLRKKSDMAMYQAKEAGRNTYHYFDEAMNVKAVENLFIRNGLRRAIDRKEFVLYYQPQIDLVSGAVTGVEALIRWNHPELGMVPPARFITIAEESGMIVQIGEWVLHEACRQAVAWKNEGRPDMTMAVNLSAVQFKRGNIEESIVNALQASGLDPKQLELELTESILIQNADKVLATVKRLKHMGIKLSIDDFGTGYSSLSYLKRFDIDKLKIDQSFVRDLATDPDDAAIVRAIIQMAKSLNLKTIAEGVETEEMQQQLRAFDCDEVQGYFYARPMPSSEIAAFLAGRNAV